MIPESHFDRLASFKNVLILILFFAQVAFTTERSSYWPYGGLSPRERLENTIREPRTPCERELQSHRYENGISAQFPPRRDGSPSVTWQGRRKNLFCECSHLPIWMMCRILMYAPDIEEIVLHRLDPNQGPGVLLPFFVLGYASPSLPLMQENPIVYTDILNHHNVLAEVYPYRSDMGNARPPPPARVNSFPLPRREPGPSEVKRSNSSPSVLNYPTKYIDIHQCTDGSPDAECPITRNNFEENQFVYILKQDEKKVAEGKSVACISAEGLRCLAKTPQAERHRGFIDPLKRTDQRRLTIQKDYTAYIISTSSGISASPSTSPSWSPSEERNAGAGPSIVLQEENPLFAIPSTSPSLSPSPKAGSPIISQKASSQKSSPSSSSDTGAGIHNVNSATTLRLVPQTSPREMMEDQYDPSRKPGVGVTAIKSNNRMQSAFLAILIFVAFFTFHNLFARFHTKDEMKQSLI